MNIFKHTYIHSYHTYVYTNINFYMYVFIVSIPRCTTEEKEKLEYVYNCYGVVYFIIIN